MRMHVVGKIVFVALMLVTVTSCAQLVPAPVAWTPEHFDVIAEDLVETTGQWVDPDKGIHVSGDVALSQSFERAFRLRGYAIVPVTGEDSMGVSVRIGLLPREDEITVGLEMDGSWRVDRIYRRAAGEVEPRSAYTIAAASRSMDGAMTEAGTKWTLARRVVRPPGVVQRSATLLDESAPTASQDNDTKVSDAPVAEEAMEERTDQSETVTCREFTLSPGSLYESVKRIVLECGWSIGSWAQDPTNTRMHVDWVVDVPIHVDASSLREFLDVLRERYGLEFTESHMRRSLEFEYATD